MRLTLEIEATDAGVVCKILQLDAPGGKSSVEVNTVALGMLEVARAALLAHRWGVNVGNLNLKPLVKAGKLKSVKRRGGPAP